MRLNQFYLLLITLSLFACKKESLPPGNTTATYTLISSGSNCSSSIVKGVYMVGAVLDASNQVILQVNVSATGTYTISTSTNYGISFSATGSFVNTGVQSISLKGAGTPATAGVHPFLFTAGPSSCSFNISIQNPEPTAGVDNDNMLFGNPSKAAALTDSTGNYLMRKTYYSLSYSRARGIPNWVSWHVYAADIGTVSRQEDFRPDESLPAGWYQVPETAYSGSGFDRGHNTPSGDRTSSNEANSSTFLMTNMIPQAPNLNQLTWANMEDSLRQLATHGSELYIVMGSYGSGGTGTNGLVTTIDGGKVTVPKNIWKIALIIPNGNNDTSRVSQSTRLIAVNMPNSNAVNGNWKNYRVTVDAIEAATGYDLLSRLPASLQTALEAKADNL